MVKLILIIKIRKKESVYFMKKIPYTSLLLQNIKTSRKNPTEIDVSWKVISNNYQNNMGVPILF